MRNWLIAGATIAVLAAGAAQAAPASQEAPVSAMRRVADWQLAHMDNFDYITAFRDRVEDPTGWVQAAFWVGMTELADLGVDPKYAAAIKAVGADRQYALGHRPLHADDHAIGQTWLWIHEQTGDDAAFAKIKARFDAILADPPQNSLEFVPGVKGMELACQPRWCWSDALFMAPSVWAGLSRETGDPRYAAYGDKEFWATTDYLYDKTDHLYYRDGRFFERKGPKGEKIFWGRGNAWVFAGIVRMLEALPADHPSRPRYETLMRQMASAIAPLQSPAGYWPASLHGGAGQNPETSAAGFFVYGLAWGVNHGVLDRATYMPVIDKGWSALLAAVEADGKLGWVQQVGNAPEQVKREDSQLYGVGAFLLAGSEMRKLKPAS
ncbi:glycoside hydrolase family 88 protein [Caulobacter sp. 73W]|uniref:Glycoside hydrolase family 88 protein n=1 Tax=Caulobacter sp. 73W TaxID=3161137 RepID=A0AB39KWK8_9CAUL